MGSRITLAILVLVIGFTAWNWLQYRQRVSDETWSLDHAYTVLGKSPQEKSDRLSRVAGEIAPTYAQREVLIVTVGIAAWLLLGLSQNPKRA